MGERADLQKIVLEHLQTFHLQLVRAQDFKLIDSIYDWVLDYLMNQFMKRVGVPLRVITAINTVANLSSWSVIQMILSKFGYAKFMNWVFWVAVIF